MNCVLFHDKPTPADVGQLCEHHVASIRELLQDNMEMFAILPEFLLPGSMPPDDGSKHTKKANIPAPVRLEVLALYDPRNPSDLDWSYESNWDHSRGRLTGNGADVPTFAPWLDGWAQYVRQGRHMGDERADRTVTGNTKTLQNHLEWLAADEWLTQFTRELRTAHRALLAGVGKSPKRPLGECYLEFESKECKGPIWLSDNGRCEMRPLQADVDWAGTDPFTGGPGDDRMTAYLVLPAETGRVVLSGRMIVGAGEDTSIRIVGDEYISNRHAEFVSMGDQWYISDAGSMNGVWVNQQRVYEYAPVHPGDQIRLGRTVLVFQQDIE